MSLQSASKPLRPRRRMELSIRFRLRPSQKNDAAPRPLLIRLTMDGVTVSDYSSGVTVRPAKWDQADQLVKGRTKSADDTNEQLEEVVTTHREILRELKKRYAKGEGPRPTPSLVKAEFLAPGSTAPTLIDFFTTYLEYLDSLGGTEDERAEKTITRAYKARDHLKVFESGKTTLLTDVKTGWGKQFHVWLQLNPTTGKRRMQKDSANKYLSHVRDCLNYAIDVGFLSNNPLDKFRPKRGKGKPVYFLESEQVDKLMAITTQDTQLSNVLWWSRLMCLTGLDYKDAVIYARNRDRFEKQTPNGKKILIARAKSEIMSEIPVLPQVEILFSMHPEGPRAPVLADINRHLKVIATLIGFDLGPDKLLTSKILRKTAGMIFLHIGYSMAAVSRFLGHSSVRVTETYYISITSSYVDSEMKRIRSARIETTD